MLRLKVVIAAFVMALISQFAALAHPAGAENENFRWNLLFTPEADTITFIGDSIINGAEQLLNTGATRYADTIYTSSTVGFQWTNAHTLVLGLIEQEMIGETVVIHLGTNGLLTDENFNDVLDELQLVDNVFIVNIKTSEAWETTINTKLAEGVGRYANATLIDWYSRAAQHPEWFNNDGTHLETEGNQSFARILLAVLDNQFSPPEPDFNGDGYADIPIGASGSLHSGASGAGNVTILYGPNPTTTTPGYFHQGTSGIVGANERNDHWGHQTYFGDFNGDGYDDLAISAPDEDIGTIVDTGGLSVLYGSETGLQTGNAWSFNQGSTGIPGANETNDRWGATLTAGDFDGDGFHDLIVGVPQEDIGEIEDAGAVIVLYGSANGLEISRSRGFNQGSAGIPGANEAGDRWGASIVATDFNGDHFDDLIVGAPSESIGSIPAAGAFTIIYGSAEGLTSTNATLFHQGTPNIPGGPEENDKWGQTLSTGDFNNDGFNDLVVGSPNESIGTKAETGAVTLIYGAAEGITTANAALLHQGSPQMAGGNEPYDKWAAVLTAGDFDGDNYDDLAIGTPNESIGSIQQAGSVTIVYGSNQGISGTRSKLFHQNSTGIPEVSETADHWGDALLAVDLNADERSDLVISSTAETILSDFDTGHITILNGTNSGLTATGSIELHQDKTNIPGTNRNGDYWGRLTSNTYEEAIRPAKGLITPSGVNVTILSETPTGYIVRTPCGNTATISNGGQVIQNVKIAIDPGHGGSVDPGATQNGIIEREINMEVAQVLLAELENRGVQAFNTRSANYHIPLSVRSAYADQLQAEAMVSIHHNSPSAPSSSDPGTESYVQSNSSASLRLGGYVQGAVFSRLDDFNNVYWVSRSDAGVLRVLNSSGTDTYGMLSRPKTPTTLVELAYISNYSEANLVKTAEYKTAMAEAISDALENFLAPPDPSEDFSSGVRTFTAGLAPGADLCTDPSFE